LTSNNDGEACAQRGCDFPQAQKQKTRRIVRARSDGRDHRFAQPTQAGEDRKVQGVRPLLLSCPTFEHPLAAGGTPHRPAPRLLRSSMRSFRNHVAFMNRLAAGVCHGEAPDSVLCQTEGRFAVERYWAFENFGVCVGSRCGALHSPLSASVASVNIGTSGKTPECLFRSPAGHRRCKTHTVQFNLVKNWLYICWTGTRTCGSVCTQEKS
jgi:hypothetical protein